MYSINIIGSIVQCKFCTFISSFTSDNFPDNMQVIT